MQNTQVFRSIVRDDKTGNVFQKQREALERLSQSLNDHIETKTFVTHNLRDGLSFIQRNATVKGIHIRFIENTATEETYQEHTIEVYVDFTTP